MKTPFFSPTAEDAGIRWADSHCDPIKMWLSAKLQRTAAANTGWGAHPISKQYSSEQSHDDN